MIQAVATILDFAPNHWNASTRLVALALADRVNPDSLECFPSLKDISRRTGLSERYIQRILRQLETENVIVCMGQRRMKSGSPGSNVWVWKYLITLGKPQTGVNNGPPGGAAHRPPHGGRRIDHPKRNNNHNEINETNKPAF